MYSVKFFFSAFLGLFLMFGSVYGYIVINEFESNPVGDDPDYEWVEIYNSGDFDENVSGWKFVNADNDTEVISTGIVPAQGYWVYTFDEFGLDNSDEGLILYDFSDMLVDHTIIGNDGYNDVRTWQRYENGNDTDSDDDWQFRDGTKIPEFPMFIMPVFVMFAALSVARKFAPHGL